MESQLPVLQLGAVSFNIDLAKGIFTDSLFPKNRIVISDISYGKPERDFVIFFNETQRRVIPAETLPDGLPVGTKLYKFPGIDKLDPVTYARMNGIKNLKNRTAPGSKKVMVAQSIALPKEYFGRVTGHEKKPVTWEELLNKARNKLDTQFGQSKRRMK